MKKISIFFLVFLFILSALAAQNDDAIEVFSVSQGLPNTQITKLFFGTKNLLWVGTSNGLCFYDGYDFNILESIPFDSTTLADDNIISIAQDKNLNIWVLTHFGLEFVNVFTNQKKRVKYIPQIESVKDLLSSPSGEYVFIIYDQGIERCKVSDFSFETLPYNFPYKILDAVLIDKSLWILNEHGIVRVDPADKISDEIFHFEAPKALKTGNLLKKGDNLLYSAGQNLFYFNISNTSSHLVFMAPEIITDISAPENNQLVISTQQTVYQLKQLSGLEFSVGEKYLENFQFLVNQVVADKNGLLWIATDKGIVKINPYSRFIRHNAYRKLQGNLSADKKIIDETFQKGFIIVDDYNNNRFVSTTSNSIVKLPPANYTAVCLAGGTSLLAGHDKGLYRINISNEEALAVDEFNGLKIYSIEQLDDDIAIATNNGIYFFDGNKYTKKCDEEILNFILSEKEIYFTEANGFGMLNKESCKKNLLLNRGTNTEYFQILDLTQSLDGKIWLATDDGLYMFNPRISGSKSEAFKLIFKGQVYAIIEASARPEIWFSTDKGIGCVDYRTEKMLFLGYEDGLRLTSYIPKGAFHAKDGALTFLTTNGILDFHPDSIFRNNNSFEISLAHADFIGNGKREVLFNLTSDTLIISPDIQYIELAFTTRNYYAPRQIQFEYSLSPVGKGESWERMPKNILSLGGVKSGTYKLKVRATNSHGVESLHSKEMLIFIRAPFHRSKFAFLTYVILLIASILLLIRFRTRSLIRINREYKEKERVARKIEQQKEELTLKNKNITDSINYARRIQLAMMPSAKLFTTFFPDSFILHMPKDIVSGDFYWVNKINDKVYFSAVDCTGHGVPGAFMSIIGVELFRRITEIEKKYTPAEVLNSLSKNFDRVFGDVEEMKLRDGMDLSFCSINSDFTSIEFSGAFNSLYIVRDSSIIEIKGDRQSVGVIHDGDNKHSFTNHIIPLQDQDLIYIFTDGFADQFGGPEGKKYKYRRFRHLLLALHQLPMENQEEFLKKSIMDWRGSMEQVDDILVMGIRVHQKK